MMESLLQKLYAYVQMSENEIIKLGDLQSAFGISSRTEKAFLSRLAKKSFIIRLKRGIYLVPARIPPGGIWQPNNLYLINQFMNVYQAKYYIGGLYAFNYYGLTEQVPNIITVYNNKVSGIKKLGMLQLQLIKVSDSRIGAFEKLSIGNAKEVCIATYPHCIVDAVLDWNRFGTLPEALSWIDVYYANGGSMNELVVVTRDFGNVSAKRRIGYYIMKMTRNLDVVAPILNTLKNSKNWVPLDPGVKGNGVTDKVWRIIDNVTK